MNLKVNSNPVNLLKQEEKGIKEKIKNSPEKQQQKEHCSKKASNAIRNLALGVIVAAGVTSTAAKQMPVYAAEANQPVNPTSVSEQAEVNTQKTDIEKVVDQSISENKQDLSSIHISSSKIDCQGKMTEESGRAYEKAEITKDGTLHFYDESSHVESKVVVTTDGNGHCRSSVIPDVKYDYKETNSFTLGTNAEKSTIKLQPGTRFEEAVEKNGDYIELAEDGKTFNVYDAEGNKIGNCTFTTKEEYDKSSKIATAVVGGMTGGAALTGGVIALKKKIDEL